MNQVQGRVDIGFGVKGTRGRGWMRFRSERRGRMGYVGFDFSLGGMGWGILKGVGVVWERTRTTLIIGMVVLLTWCRVLVRDAGVEFGDRGWEGDTVA